MHCHSGAGTSGAVFMGLTGLSRSHYDAVQKRPLPMPEGIDLRGALQMSSALGVLGLNSAALSLRGEQPGPQCGAGTVILDHFIRV